MKGRFKKQLGLLRDFCRATGLHRSGVREMILLKFLATEHHITAAQFHEKLKKEHRSLDLKTVQSALDLLVGAGLARELRLEDGSLIFEHVFAHRHHDHLICRRCGGMIEFQNPAIEKLQEEVASQHGFVVEDARSGDDPSATGQGKAPRIRPKKSKTKKSTRREISRDRWTQPLETLTLGDRE